MKLIGIFACLLLVAVSSIHADDDIESVGDKIPASAVLAAVQAAVQDGTEFIAVDDVIAAVDNSDSEQDETPVSTGIIKRCKSGKCRKKCNAKGKNGACLWLKCVCWK